MKTEPLRLSARRWPRMVPRRITAWRPEGVRQCASSPRPPRPRRLAAARILRRRTLSRRRNHHRLAPRAAPQTIWPARSRETGSHLRHHPIQPDRTRRAGSRVVSSRSRRIPGTQAGAEAVAAHAGVRRAGGRGTSGTSSRLRGCPDFQGAGAHAARAEPLAGVRTIDHSHRMSEPAPTCFACWTASESEMVARRRGRSRGVVSSGGRCACRAGHVRCGEAADGSARTSARLAR